MGNKRLRIAIGDYYHAFQQRSKWLSEGLIYPRELENYEEYLIGEWRREFEIMQDDIQENANEGELARSGKDLFNWSQRNHFQPIRTNYRDVYLSRGSYHILANDLRIGWHPEF